MAYDGKTLKPGNSQDFANAAVIGSLWALFGVLFFVVICEGLNQFGIAPDLIREMFVLLYAPGIVIGSIIIHRSWRVTLMMVMISLPIMLFFFCLIGMVQGFGLPV